MHFYSPDNDDDLQEDGCSLGNSEKHLRIHKHADTLYCFGEGDLELYKGNFKLTTLGWEDEEVISLQEAAKLSNTLNEFQGSLCKCGAPH